MATVTNGSSPQATFKTVETEKTPESESKQESKILGILKKALGAFLAINAVSSLAYVFTNWSDKKAHFIRFNMIAGIALGALAIILLL
jgi:hypothetical protein